MRRTPCVVYVRTDTATIAIGYTRTRRGAVRLQRRMSRFWPEDVAWVGIIEAWNWPYAAITKHIPEAGERA